MKQISIITICFNNLSDLKLTNESIDVQTNQDFEHIIIDGSNNNEIKSYLESNSQPEYRTWICERDHGIADAFNKGIKLAKGKYIVLLNSGDKLFHSTVIEIVANLLRENTVKWLHGKYAYERGGHKIVIGKPFKKKLLYRGMRRVCHQTMFVSKSLYDKHGLYDESEKIAMDYDFLCRISLEPFIFTDEVLAEYDTGGTSEVNYSKGLIDARRIYLKYFPYPILMDVWRYRQLLLFNLLNSKIGRILFSIKKGIGLENW